MERCKDYFSFAVWFAGIGYAVLWPLAAIGNGGRLFGASFLCRGSGRGIAAALCSLPHPVSLPLGLHVLGVAAAVTVGARLFCRLLRRQRACAIVSPATTARARLADGELLVRAPARRLRTVTPRKHFGLRGTPH